MTAAPGGLHPVQVRHRGPGRYVPAVSLHHAVQLLADPGLQPARIIAGGTDLLLEIERGVRRGVATLIDISAVPGAGSITVTDGDARLGPMVTHNDVVGSAALVMQALPLAQACWEVGSAQLRNRATVAGNLLTASPANDTISALLALGATAELHSARGLRRVPVEAFFTGFRTTVAEPDELLSAIEVPLLGAGQRGIFVKLANRAAQAISVLHLAVVVGLDEDGVVRSARIALGSVAATVVLAPAAAEVLVGRTLDAEAIDDAAAAAAASVSPIDDIRATAEYRRRTLPVALRRALHTLAADRQRERWPVHPPMLSSGHTIPTSTSSASDASANATDATATVFDAGTVVTATVNGKRRAAAGAVGATLLEWLRDELAVLGPKEGCAEGECGACTVSLDGAAVMACLVPAARAHGSEVTTVEGLAEDGDGGLHRLQQAFVDCAAVQCGFCTPGLLVAGAQLLAEIPRPSKEQLQQGLAGNLCRCTGYTSIIAAMQQAAGADQ
ncbi:MAG: FAD binding domain-containing protein [Acidimicrobiales bacterium]